jgi:aspartate racemase
MHGIYSGVKVGNMALAYSAFASVAKALAHRHGLQTLVLGCTEIPLALSSVPGMPDLRLIDPAELLAQALAERAYRLAA